MAVDCEDNETLIPVNPNHCRQTDSGSESAIIGSWGSSSSSSFLTPSFGSELDSNDADLDDGNGTGDDDEFIARLTRQMANYMLEDNDDNGSDENPPQKHSSLLKGNFQEPTYQNHEQIRRSYADTVKKSIVGLQSEEISTSTNDKPIQPPIQLYQVEHQPRVGGQSQNVAWGRRGKMSELTQTHSNNAVRGSKEYVNGGKGHPHHHGVHGSGMRAIFLGGSGSQNVINGTGVFLPRSIPDATDHGRKKRGCSTVLVPTRVLQALEQHFQNSKSLSPSTSLAQIHPKQQDKKDRIQVQESSSVNHQESKLPQEWTY